MRWQVKCIIKWDVKIISKKKWDVKIDKLTFLGVKC